MSEEITIIAIGLRKIEMKLLRFSDGAGVLRALDAEQPSPISERRPKSIREEEWSSQQKQSKIIGIDDSGRAVRVRELWRTTYCTDDPNRRKRKSHAV